MAEQTRDILDRETLDNSIRVRVSDRVHGRLLSVVGQNGTVSEYVRRLLEAAMNEDPTPRMEEIVPQTLEPDCDKV